MIGLLICLALIVTLSSASFGLGHKRPRHYRLVRNASANETAVRCYPHGRETDCRRPRLLVDDDRRAHRAAAVEVDDVVEEQADAA